MLDTILFQYTYRCNISCRHCCYDCGPNGDEMSQKEIEKSLDGLPDASKLIISGGEPTLDMDKVRLIAEKSGCEVHLQTNAWWVKDLNSSYDMLRRFQDIGIKELHISRDRFHSDAGIDDSFPMTLVDAWTKLECSTWNEMKYSYGGTDSAFPMGRATGLPEEEQLDKLDCQIQKYRAAVIDPFGDVYLCCWKKPFSVGSVFKESLGKIIEDSEKDPIISKFRKKGYAMSPHNSLNPCIECVDFFSI